MLKPMDDPSAAQVGELPSYETVVRNTDDGYATLLPILVAWRIAVMDRLTSNQYFVALCTQQLNLLEQEVGRSDNKSICALISFYRIAAGRSRRSIH
ncbi:hypothetical protein [Sphingomonas sp. UYP23]